MAFDPDAYLASPVPAFDPDAYLAAPPAAFDPETFNPDAYLAAPAQPETRAEFGARQDAQAARPLLDKAGDFIGGIGEGIGQVAGTIGAGLGELWQTEDLLPRLPATVMEAATRGTYDTVDLGRRIAASDLAAVPQVLANPLTLTMPETRKKLTSLFGLMDKEEKLERDYQKYLENFAWEQTRQEGLDGSGNLAPQFFGAPLESAAEMGSLALDPTLAVPLAGQATKLARLGRTALAGGIRPAAAAAEVAGRGVNQGILGGMDAARVAMEARGVDPTLLRSAAGTVGAGSLWTTPGQVLASTMAGAKGVEMAGAAARAGVEEFARGSQLRISERIARDVNRPRWLRQAAQLATGIPEPLTRTAGAAIEGAMQGAALGGALAVASEQDARGIGAGIGSGGLLGAGGAALGAQLPAARRAARTRAENGDIVRMLDRQEALGGNAERVAALPRPDQLRLATMDRILSDGADIVLLDGPRFTDQTGQPAAAGVFRQSGPDGRQQIFVNLDAGTSAVRAVAHEVGHALATHPAVNRDAVRLALDAAYGTAGLEARGREYAQRLLEAERGPITPPAIEARFQQLRAEATARGDLDGLNWVRDEIFAEHIAAEISGRAWGIDQMKGKMPPGADASRLRETWWTVKQRLLDVFGVPFTDTGRLAVPESTLFRDHPLVADPALRRVLYRSLEERAAWLRGLHKGAADAETHAGAPLVRSSGMQSLAEHPAIEWRPRPDGTFETDFATKDASGRVRMKDPAEIARAETARQEQARALMPRDLIPASERRMGRKIIDGREVVAGDTLPPLFDHAVQFSPETIRAARAMEAARASGETFSLWYHQIGSGTNGRWSDAVKRRLGNVAATQRELSLVGWEMTKVGNFIGRMLDVGAARQRAFELAEAGRLELWGGSVDAFQGDVLTYLDNHAAGRPGETGLGTSKRDFINGFFGVATRANRAANPIYSGTLGRSLIKSFRLDRMHRVQPTGRTGWGVNYPKMRDNLLPNFMDAARAEMQNNENARPSETAQTGQPRGSRPQSPEDAGAHLAAAIAHTRGDGPRSGAESPAEKSARRVIEARRLYAWARDNGRLIDPPRRKDDAGGEHDVWKRDDGRYGKATHADRFGLHPDIDWKQDANGAYTLMDFHADRGTPAEYLERLEIAREVFGDSVRLEGIAIVDGQMRIVTSQKAILGEHPDFQTEIIPWMAARGFQYLGTPGYSYEFYNPHLNVLVMDARPANLKRSENRDLVPIDLMLSRPSADTRALAESRLAR